MKNAIFIYVHSFNISSFIILIYSLSEDTKQKEYEKMEIINFEPQIDDLNFFVANMLSKISNSDSYKDMGESSKKVEYLTFILIA